MSYRSDVKLCIRKKDYEELKDRYDKLKEECGEDNVCFLDEDYCDITEKIGRGWDNQEITEPIVVLSWDNVKWYSEFKDVRLIEDFLEELDENNIDFSFIRLGEDYEDVDMLENWNKGYCDVLRFERYIDVED